MFFLFAKSGEMFMMLKVNFEEGRRKVKVVDVQNYYEKNNRMILNINTCLMLLPGKSML